MFNKKEDLFIIVIVAVFFIMIVKFVLKMKEGLVITPQPTPIVDKSIPVLTVQDKYTDVNAVFSDAKLLQIVYSDIDKIVDDLQPYVNNTVKIKDILSVGSIKYVPPTDDTPVVTIDGKYTLDPKGNYSGKQVLNLVLSKGLIGVDGPRGPIGQQGPDGPVGPQGPMGNPGCERMTGSYP